MAHKAKVNALCTLWTFDPVIIEKVFLGLGGDSMDNTDEYLEIMDSEGVTDPALAWEEWQRRYDIHHEPNPFLSEED